MNLLDVIFAPRLAREAAERERSEREQELVELRRREVSALEKIAVETENSKS